VLPVSVALLLVVRDAAWKRRFVSLAALLAEAAVAVSTNGWRPQQAIHAVSVKGR
jgi:hypothetical protein